jgi:hypothetical protein
MLKERKTGEKKVRRSDHKHESDKVVSDVKKIRKRNEEEERIKEELDKCL